MSAKTCEHHWHPSGAYIDRERNERVSVQTCCHCGERSEHRMQLYGAGAASWEWTQKDCGPHAPKSRPFFATEGP